MSLVSSWSVSNSVMLCCALLGGVSARIIIIWVGPTNALTIDPMRQCHAVPGVAVTRGASATADPATYPVINRRVSSVSPPE